MAALTAMLLAIAAGYLAARGTGGGAMQSAFQSPERLVLAIIGLLALVLIFQRPEWGLLAVVVLLYTNASDAVVHDFGLPSPLQVATIVAALAVLHRVNLREFAPSGARVVLDPLLIPLSLYGAAIFLSSLAAMDLEVADERLMEFLKGLLVFVVMTNLATSKAMLRRIIWALVLSGAFLATISAYQVLTGSYDNEFAGFGNIKVAEIVAESRKPRIAGPLSDPNFYAQILVMLAPIALYRFWDEQSPGRKALAGYALFVVALAAVSTFSRGGAIALAFVTALALVQKKVRLRHLVPVLLALLPLSYLAPQSVSDRLGTLVQLAPTGADDTDASVADSSFRDRRRLMTVAWQMFSDHPLIGVGAGNYSDHFDQYADQVGMTVSSYEKFGREHFPHNLYLQFAAELGVTGLLAFAAIVVASFAALRRAYARFAAAGDIESADMVVSVALGLLAFLVTSLFLHGTYIRYMWLLVAIAAAARQIALRTSQEHGGG